MKYHTQKLLLYKKHWGPLDPGLNISVAWYEGLTPIVVFAFACTLGFLVLAFGVGLARPDGTAYLRIPETWVGLPRVRKFLSPLGNPAEIAARVVKRRARVTAGSFVVVMVVCKKFKYL